MVRRRLLAVASVLGTLVVTAGPVPQAHAACAPPPAVGSALADVPATGFVPIAPTRIADTRNGIGVATAPIEAGCVLRVSIAAADPPAGATAVALTITSDRASRTGYVTAYGCASPRPETSSLNPRPGDPTPNLAVVQLDATRELCFFSEQDTDLIVDVTGWFTPAGSRFHEVAPVRALDTRTAGLDTGLVGPAATVTVPLAGPVVPATATAVAVTVTLTRSTTATYATAYPCGSAVPPTSTTNVLAGRDRGAPALVGLGGGALCVYVDRPSHVIVDVTGWFGPDDTSAVTTAVVGSPLEELGTVRVADTRNGIGTGGARARLAAGSELRLSLLDTAPVGTTSVQLNLVATEATAAGYLTAYPCDTTRPEVSAVNFRPDVTETAMVTVGLGPSGAVCVYTSSPTHVVADLFAAYGTPGSLHSLATDPALDQQVLPGQLDHTVHCPAGGGPVTVGVEPPPGVLASIDGAAPAAGRAVVVRNMAPDEAVVVRLSGAVTEEHWIRCLPATFPQLTPTGHAPTPGWYLASSLGATSYVFILDEYGVPVWYKRTPFPMIGVWPQANGDLTLRRWTGGGFPGGAGTPETPPLGFVTYGLDGQVVSTVGPPASGAYAGEPLDWHDIIDLPAGGHAVVVYDLRTTGTSRQCVTPTGASVNTTQVADSVLVELDAAGNEIWSWNSKDHTDIDDETTLPNCFQVATSGTPSQQWALDYMHLNSAHRLDDGDYLISARHFDAVERIDRTTGNVVWKLGGTPPDAATNPGVIDLTLLDVNGDPAGPGTIPGAPHDARMLADGNVTMHDNRPGSHPRADEFAITIDAGGTSGSARLVWQYQSTNATGNTLGSVRRQPDGTTVIAWGEGTSPWLEEVSASGQRLLAVTLPPGILSYRAVKVDPATYDRAALRAAAGGATA